MNHTHTNEAVNAMKARYAPNIYALKGSYLIKMSILVLQFSNPEFWHLDVLNRMNVAEPPVRMKLMLRKASKWKYKDRIRYTRLYDRINYLRRIRRNKQIEFDGALSHRTPGDVATSELPIRIPEDTEIQYNNIDFNNIPL